MVAGVHRAFQGQHGEHVAGLVLDLTAVWMVDSHLCSVLSNLGRAAALLGARTVISGMRPEIAMTLQAMGIELGGLETTRALEAALESLGIVPQKAKRTRAR